MVAQERPEYPSDWPAICAVAEKLGIGTAETLRKWVRQAEVDAGQRPGVTSEESAEIRRLKRRTPSCAGRMGSSRRRRLSSRLCHDHDCPAGFALFFAVPACSWWLVLMCGPAGYLAWRDVA